MSVVKNYLQKLILEINLGSHQAIHRKRVVEHITKLLDLKQSWVEVKCRNPVAKWGTRKNHILGVRITLRGAEAHRIVSLLKCGIIQKPPVRDNNLFQGGIRSHRVLGLQRYDYRAPEYGLNYKLCFGFLGMGAWTRRIQPCTKRMPLLSNLENYLHKLLC